MAQDSERKALFDHWSDRYQESVESDDRFPFWGYQKVLRRTVQKGRFSTGQTVLDLGTGTGNLIGLLPVPKNQVWGVDFSPAMLQKAQFAFPDAHFHPLDLLSDDWSCLEGLRFDRIVSAYVFHEFTDQEKIGICCRLASDFLTPTGLIVIADISFLNQALFLQYHQKLKDLWDPDEYYWCAAEMAAALIDAGFMVDYQQVSPCAGIYSLQIPAEN